MFPYQEESCSINHDKLLESTTTFLLLRIFVFCFFNQNFLMDAKTKKILLIDSSAIAISRLKRLMSEMKNLQFVGVAVNSTEANAIIKLMKPDVVILDIQLPGNNGMHVLREIKNNYSTVQVIVLTNNSELYYRNLCKESGADYFFDKSTEFERVPEVLVSQE